MTTPILTIGAKRSIPSFHRNAFVAILVLWMIMPFALSARAAQDAVPYLAAGRLVHSHPTDVYAARHGDLFDLRPVFRAEWCRIAPPGTDCDNLAVAFVAAPPVIPLTIALTALGDRGGMLAMRLAAAAMLVAGMWLLWRRLAHRARHAPAMLVATALLLTPMAMVPIGLGQTSSILFLSVCLGLRSRSRRESTVAGVIWACASALKIFPAALVLIVVWRRRWRMLVSAAATLVVLSALTSILITSSVWETFIRTTLQLNAHTTTNPYNGAVNAFVIRLAGSSTSTGVAAAARVVSLIAAAAVCWFGMRRTEDDTRWAAGYVALLLVTPVVWWHYTWVVIGALGIAVGAQRRVNDRVLAILPIAAVISVAPSIPIANGHSSSPIAQAVLLLAGAGAFCVLARRSAELPLAVERRSGGTLESQTELGERR